MAKYPQSENVDTLKRKKLIQEIPKSKTLREASLKAGYSANSRQIYTKNTRQYIKSKLDCKDLRAEDIIEEFFHALDDAMKSNDNTNRVRILEDLGRIKALFIDKSEVKSEVKIVSDEEKSELIEYRRGIALQPAQN